MKKYIVIALFALLGLTACEKEEEVKKQSNCPTIVQKRAVHVVRGNYYYYLDLSNGKEVMVSESEWYKWLDGAEYTPQCVKN